MSVKVSGKGLEDIKKSLAFFKSNRCLVGIPQAKGSRKNGELTNVELAFIHSNGSPKHAIPARPFLEPAIAQPEVQAKIAERMKAAAMQAIEGNTDAALAELDKAGFYGENAAKDYFGSGNHAPNAGITVEGGWMKNKVSGKIFHVKGKHSTVPLIDTGSLRSSITHVIEKR